MKITRFAQSCILIETNGKRILIDPGYLQYKESYPSDEWSNIYILLITHKHGDHCHLPAILEIVKNPKTKFYTSYEVAKEYPKLSPEIVKQGDVIRVDNDIKIEVVKAVHGFVPHLKGGHEINENVGYIIDDGDKRVYLTSDSICFDNDYKCDILLVPVNNHGLCMGPFEAAAFAKEREAKLVIPIHYDNPKFPADLEKVKEEFNEQDLNFKFLKIEETIEV